MAVDRAIPDVAREFGDAVRGRLRTAGGLELCRRAEQDPSLRAEVGDLLAPLGLWELDVRADADQAAVAAEAVRTAGALVVPYPLVARLLGDADAWLAVVRDGGPLLRIEHGDLAPSWLVAGLDGSSATAAALHPGTPSVLAPFVCRGDRGPAAELVPATDPVPATDVALWLTLDAFWLLGAAGTALERTVEHLRTRRQFGRPLANFQGVRLRVAECVTLLEGLRELCWFTLWRQHAAPADATVDALALRTVALEAVGAVFAAAHQFHGAVGFSLEHDLALLHRHVQGHVRLPVDHEDLGRLLVEQVERDGFDSLFGRFQGTAEGGR
jgi:hypothetical protein